MHEVLLELAEGRVLKPEHFELRQAFASGAAAPSSRGRWGRPYHALQNYYRQTLDSLP